MWRAGDPVSDIGEEIGLSDDSVYRLVRRLGLGRADRPKRAAHSKPRQKPRRGRGRNEHLSGAEIDAIGVAFCGGEPSASICDRWRISDGTLSRLWRRQGWRRPADYDAAHNRRVVDDELFAEMWNANAVHREMMRQFSVSRSWVVRHAQMLGLPRRDQNEVWRRWRHEKSECDRQQRERLRARALGEKSKLRDERIAMMVRLHNQHYGTDMIGERFGIKPETVRKYLCEARKVGNNVRRSYRYLSGSEKDDLRQMRRLGVSMRTAALMLGLDYRQAISLSARLGGRHRNYHSALLSVLSPERLLGAEREGYELEHLLQDIYRRTDESRVAQLRRVWRDYREALSLFPDLPAAENPVPGIVVLRRAPLRTPHPRLFGVSPSIERRESAEAHYAFH